VEVTVGTLSSGQGHETSFTQCVAEWLGVDFEAGTLIQGDTDVVPGGDGTGGCRSLVIDGSALKVTLDMLIEKARRIAADALEVAEPDVEFAEGAFRITGTDRIVSFREVARLACDQGAPLEAVEGFQPRTPTFPNGCHVCEVEIDPDTGATEIVNYTMVHDAGRLINPTVVEGQLHGGVAQGLGQALMEHAIWERDSGQMITGSFMDYAMPRAETFGPFHIRSNPVPTKTNPLGVKGAGEAGCVGALAAVANAVVDALSEFGIRHIEMPATPERLWRAIREARRKSASP
jgi:carbon-monoxide dehydrogenase large subunit